MKKLGALVLLTFLACHLFAQPCSTPPGLLMLDSIEQINRFQADYGPCTTVPPTTTIEIRHSRVTDACGLEDITEYQGGLFIFISGLTDLDAFQNVTYIGPYPDPNPSGDALGIIRNDFLENLDGLRNLDTIEGNFQLGQNPALTNVDGLSKLDSCRDLVITSNDGLLNLDGLCSLNTTRNVIITNNSMLSMCCGLFPLFDSGTFGGTAINNNLTDCNSVSEIQSCSTVPDCVDLPPLDPCLPGACCFDNGTCEALTPYECAARGGSYQGSGVVCREVMTYYMDKDDDGYSDGTTMESACDPGSDYKLEADLIDTSVDCNDDDENINPGADEVCDGIDNDCDGLVDPCSTPPGLLILDSIEQINRFQAQYGPCTTVPSTTTIEIRHPRVTDACGLEAITEYQGGLFIFMSGLTDLDAFQNVTYIGPYPGANPTQDAFGIIRNDFLENLNGLRNLDTINGNFQLGQNPALTNVDGLSKLKSCRDLVISNNDGLLNLDGLCSLNATRNVIMSGNPMLSMCCGLSPLLSSGNFAQTAIGNNASGCNSFSEIQACTTIPECVELAPLDPCSLGACCFDDGTCTALTAKDCAIRGGSFQGSGVVCPEVMTYYLDKDDDGYSDGTTMESACDPGSDYKLEADLIDTSVDCNDEDENINPGADEVCDGIDNDCDGLVDDDDSGISGNYTYYADNDGDGFGAGPPISFCASTPPSGFSENNQDCNDDNADLTFIGDSCDDMVNQTVDDFINDNCICVGGRPIPTISEWGMILIFILMSIVGIIAIKQRKVIFR